VSSIYKEDDPQNTSDISFIIRTKKQQHQHIRAVLSQGEPHDAAILIHIEFEFYNGIMWFTGFSAKSRLSCTGLHQLPPCVRF